MKTQQAIVCILKCAVLFSVVAGSVSAQGLFHIEQERIIGPDGKVFIAHGVNYQGPMFSWPNNPPVATIADKMSIWKFNLVRLNWRVYDCPNGCLNPCGAGVAYTQQKNPPIETHVSEFVKRKNMVAMIDNHDYTCKSKVGSCINGRMVDFWTKMANAFGTQSTRSGKYNSAESAVQLTETQASMIWFDLRNEPLGSGTELFDQLAKDYEAIIKAIRATGAKNIIVLEGSNWGRDYANSSWIKKWGPYFRDKYQNIAFSHHSYGWKSKSDLMAYYQWMTDNNLPMIVGECSLAEGGIEVTHANYGDESGSWATGGFTTSGAAYEKGIGLVYWAFWGGDDAKLCTSGNGGGHNISVSNGVPTNLTEEGKIVWADIRRGDKTWDAPCGGQGCGATDIAVTTPIRGTDAGTAAAYTLGGRRAASIIDKSKAQLEQGAYVLQHSTTNGRAGRTTVILGQKK